MTSIRLDEQYSKGSRLQCLTRCRHKNALIGKDEGQKTGKSTTPGIGGRLSFDNFKRIPHLICPRQICPGLCGNLIKRVAKAQVVRPEIIYKAIWPVARSRKGRVAAGTRLWSGVCLLPILSYDVGISELTRSRHVL